MQIICKHCAIPNKELAHLELLSARNAGTKSPGITKDSYILMKRKIMTKQKSVEAISARTNSLDFFL